jgi:DNA invertase Pin-like site-specific DNA recombinase
MSRREGATNTSYRWAADEVRIDCVDDGRAGDDFLTRNGLRQLLAEAKRGDVIVCRDQSHLGPTRSR